MSTARANAVKIFDANKAALDRGMLSIWTIYNRPRDFPDTFVARRFDYDKPTEDFITGDLPVLRESMQMCGLYRMPRDESDPPNIVESWM